MKLPELLDQIRGTDPEMRTAAWQQTGAIGAPAIPPLAKLAAEGEMEPARAARRGLEKIVRTAGAPGGETSRAAVIGELLGLLAKKDDPPAALRRDLLWLLSEIGGDESVGGIAELLGDKAVREDARMALERIPGEKALGALRSALVSAPEDFRPNIAQSLRARGEAVDPEKYPCQKLIPTK